MSGTVFDSYIKSVYGSGSSMEYFDSIDGGSHDIFGGLGPTEIFDSIEGGSYNHSIEDYSIEGSSDNNHIDSIKDESDDESDNESEKSVTKKDDTPDDSSIIGYIQIGIHSTPIVGETDNKCLDGGLTAPIKIQLWDTKKTEISPDDISDALFRLN